MSTSIRRGRVAGLAAVAVAGALALSACSSSGGGADSKTINLVGFSTPKPAYAALEAGFQKTSAGKGVKFSESYDASGSQSKAVASGNVQLDKVDKVTTAAADVSQNVAALTALFAATVGGPMIKAAAFSHGVRRALSGLRSRSK